jgi:YhcH/YjgK/YiaL family protein
MILDVLENADRYLSLNPRFAAAFAFLKRPDLATLATGKHPIEGDALFAIVAKEPGRRRAEAKLEAHRKYIDIQFVLEGSDEMGWRPVRTCRTTDKAYAPERDIVFFTDEPDTWVVTRPGAFCIFFPDDAHAPLVSDSAIHKIVVKVAVA